MKVFRKKLESTRLIFFLVFLLWTFPVIAGNDAYADDKKTIELGKKVYEKHCVICHGEKGNGKGSLFAVVQENSAAYGTYPRDFTIGVFRLRSTSTGCLPINSDIQRIISNGILRSYMPEHPELPADEIKAVIEYVKTFFKEWEDIEPCKPITAKKPTWLGSPKSVKRGEELWKDMKCWECHGYQGKGDGPKSNDLKDDWGKQIIPYDFTSGTTKRGDSPEDIYMAYTTGLDGSSMPSYEDSMSEIDRWHLVSYTLKLMGRVK